MPKEDLDPNEMDEIIHVTLPRSDYLIMREMIDKQKSLDWIGKYMRNILFVTLGGLLTVVAFGEQLKKLISILIGGS